MDVSVTDAAERQRYEARVGDELAGIAEYVADDGLVTFVHTEVVDGFEGHGIGSTLVRAALEDVRRQRRSVRAECEFVAGYLARHAAEYGDLVPPPGNGASG